MISHEYPRILTAGDGCVVAEFGDSIDLEINSRVAALGHAVRKLAFPGLLDTVPTYRSLAVYFDPEVTDVERLYERMETLCREGGREAAETVRRTIVIPTLYGGENGPDMEDVAAHTGLSPEEIVRIHTSRDCYCYMLGFTPGYSYLGGMDPSLETPRLKNPREIIPSGSVAIGGKQTGIYSIPSPGGWRLIGRTPVQMFDARRTPAIFLEAGMWVRFRPIGGEEFSRIDAESSAGKYCPEIIEEEVSPS